GPIRQRDVPNGPATRRAVFLFSVWSRARREITTDQTEIADVDENPPTARGRHHAVHDPGAGRAAPSGCRAAHARGWGRYSHHRPDAVARDPGGGQYRGGLGNPGSIEPALQRSLFPPLLRSS